MKGSEKRAQETFNQGFRDVEEVQKQERSRKRAQLSAGIEEGRATVKRISKAIEDMEQELMVDGAGAI